MIAGKWTGLRIAKVAAAATVAVLAAAFLWLYFLDWNTMRGPVGRYASAKLGRTVRIDGNLAVHLFSFTPRVSASGVTIANPAWAGRAPAADISNFTFTVRLWPFLFGHTILPLVEIDRPNVVVLRRGDGSTNWDLGGPHNAKTGWNLPPIQRFLLHDGHIRIDDRVRKLVFTGTMSSEESAGTHAFQLTGQGTLNGQALTADVRGGPLLHVDETKPYHFTAELHAGATRLSADGTIARPFHLGQFSAAATIYGPNLSQLYEVTGLAMPQTAAYRIKGTLSRDATLYRFRDFSGVVGSSDLSGNLAIDGSGDKPLVTGAVYSKVLDFKDLGHLFGGKSQAAIASGRLLPDEPLHLDRLRQMDAEVDYDAKAIRSQDFPLRGLHMHVALHRSVLVLDPVAFRFAYGRFSGKLHIDATKAVPATSVDARLSDIQVAQFMTSKPAAAEGVLEAHMVLHGTGSSVHQVASTAGGQATFVVPQGQFRKSFAELTGIDVLNGIGLLLSNNKETTGLRCAVANFGAADGVLATRQFVFDTDPVRVDGKGTIDLKNETLDFAVTGKPKEFRIGRVRAPILITGRLDHPKVGVKAQDALLQGGIAIGLGLLFPPAAILPFVDPGLAKKADCVGLLTAASAQGTPHLARHARR